MNDLPHKAPDPEVVYVDKRRVACNGDGGALGHPLVWYALDDGEAECGYCDRKFIYDPERAKSSAAAKSKSFAAGDAPSMRSGTK